MSTVATTVRCIPIGLLYTGELQSPKDTKGFHALRRPTTTVLRPPPHYQTGSRGRRLYSSMVVAHTTYYLWIAITNHLLFGSGLVKPVTGVEGRSWLPAIKKDLAYFWFLATSRKIVWFVDKKKKTAAVSCFAEMITLINSVRVNWSFLPYSLLSLRKNWILLHSCFLFLYGLVAEQKKTHPAPTIQCPQ